VEVPEVLLALVVALLVIVLLELDASSTLLQSSHMDNVFNANFREALQ